MTPPAYEIRGLSWRLGPQFALEIPSLDLPRGRTTALLGRSASGKSTLLSLLGRVEGAYFERPVELRGEIRLHAGVDAPLELLALSERELIARRLRGAILGFVFQREGLFPGRSVMGNVAWPLKAAGVRASDAEARAEAALTAVALSPSRVVATLSGGERKRLALARSLALEPAVMLLDEPLTGLDPEALDALLEVLAGIAADPERTIVLVTHQQGDVERLAEHVVFMDHGRVAAQGPRAAVASTLAGYFRGEMVDAPIEEG